MKTTSIATGALSQSLRLSLAELQAKLIEAQKEVASGRLADVGAGLGLRAAEVVSLRQEHARLQSITDSNGLVASRLEAAQAALRGLADNAQEFMGNVISARDSADARQIVQRQAQAALSAFANALNSSFSGAHLFAGINADAQPITDYNQTPPPAGAQAVANAFATTFGFPQSDPAASSITPAAMQNFLDGTFAGLFDAAAWSTTWSAASDQNVKSRISTSELIETSVNANEEAFRKLASAYTMLADLGVASLSEETYQTVVDAAVRAVGAAVAGLTELQAGLGTAQERISNANARMSIQIDIMNNHIGALEGVDPYEASTRLSSLMTQIETAYAVSARIHKLTILDFL